MNFSEIALARQSCRSYDCDRPVEKEKISSLLAAARFVIALGYPKDDPPRDKKRRSMDELVTYM